MTYYTSILNKSMNRTKDLNYISPLLPNSSQKVWNHSSLDEIPIIQNSYLNFPSDYAYKCMNCYKITGFREKNPLWK